MLTLTAVTVILLIIAALASAEKSPPRKALPPPCEVQCLEAKNAALQKLAVKRLKLLGQMERSRNHARSFVRRLIRQHGTGVPWLDDALCIHGYESVNWFLDGHHDGGMQFNPGTWHRAGGSGYAYQAAPIEQLYRSYRIWQMDGGSWREWSTAGMCGL